MSRRRGPRCQRCDHFASQHDAEGCHAEDEGVPCDCLVFQIPYAARSTP